MKILCVHGQDLFVEQDAYLAFSADGRFYPDVTQCLMEAECSSKPAFIAWGDPSVSGFSYFTRIFELRECKSDADAELLARFILDNAQDLLGPDNQHWISGSSGLADLLRTCESPIEAKLALRLWLQVRDPSTLVAGQLPIGRYRVDFAVTHSRYHLAVEADGHDFHERTKEQAQRDKQRDRELQAQGWRVLRFTGSEIHRDAVRCAAQVSETICSLLTAGAS